jgi:hypothetical protein
MSRFQSSTLILAVGIIALATATALPGAEPTKTAQASVEKTSALSVLQQLEGRWDYTGTVYPEAVFNDPKAESIPLTGALQTEFMPGNLWLVTTAKGEAKGTPYQYLVILGYDAAKDKYSSVEANSLTGAPFRLEGGTYDATTKTFRWIGTTIVPGASEPAMTKVELFVENSDTLTTTAFLKRPGSEKFVRWYDFFQKRALN